jgi:hypothetical protein
MSSRSRAFDCWARGRAEERLEPTDTPALARTCEKPVPDGAVLPINRPAVGRQHSLAASHYPLTLAAAHLLAGQRAVTDLRPPHRRFSPMPGRGRLNQGTRAPGLGY